ncbi:MAG: NADH-quinone oxidoreductase subunit B family protein [bacterium]
MAIWTFDGLRFGVKSVEFPKENDFYEGFYSYIKFDADKCLNFIKNGENILSRHNNNVLNENNSLKLKCSKCREVCPTAAIDLSGYYKNINKDNDNKYNKNYDVNSSINDNGNINIDASYVNINIIDIKKCIYCGLCVSECLNISKAISFDNYIDKDNINNDIINNLKFNAFIDNFNNNNFNKDNKGSNNNEHEENKNNKDKNDAKNNFSNNKNKNKNNFFKKSLFVKHIDTGSCGACESEIIALNNPYYNMHRLGIFITPSPRFADVILLTGVFTDKMSDIFYNVLDNTPKPRFILLAGACPLSGGIYSECSPGFLKYKNNEDILKSENIVLVPGCPPNPFMILNALLSIKSGALV